MEQKSFSRALTRYDVLSFSFSYGQLTPVHLFWSALNEWNSSRGRERGEERSNSDNDNNNDNDDNNNNDDDVD